MMSYCENIKVSSSKRCKYNIKLNTNTIGVEMGINVNNIKIRNEREKNENDLKRVQ